MSEARRENSEEKPLPEKAAEEPEEVAFYYQMRLPQAVGPTAKESTPQQAKALDRWISKLVVIYGALFLMLNGVAVLALLMRKYRMVVDGEALMIHSLYYSIPALALFLLFTLLLLGGSAKSRAHLAFSGVIAAPMFIFFGWISSVTLNGILDNSPAMERSVMVVNKYKARGSSETVPDYFVSLKAWKPDAENIGLKIHEGLFNVLEPGISSLKVATHPGWMGHEWIAGYESIKE